MTDVHELAVRLVSIDALTPHPQNYREHPDAQIEHIMQSIRDNGFYRNIVVARDNTILAGHGVVEAARRLGVDTVPIVKLDLAHDDPRAIKVLVADNELARIASNDDTQLADLLALIQAETSVGLLGTGYDANELAALRDIASFDSAGDAVERGDSDATERYSRVVESPVYTITGEKPDITELIDDTRTVALEAQIDAADLSDDVKAFLYAAAARHLVFDYAKIAEFYAHSYGDVQALMEESALVILDVDRAIELGFAKLADDVREIAADAEASDDDA